MKSCKSYISSIKKTILWNIIQIWHGNKKLWHRHGFRVCVHSYLCLSDMTFVRQTLESYQDPTLQFGGTLMYDWLNGMKRVVLPCTSLEHFRLTNNQYRQKSSLHWIPTHECHTDANWDFSPWCISLYTFGTTKNVVKVYIELLQTKKLVAATYKILFTIFANFVFNFEHVSLHIIFN